MTVTDTRVRSVLAAPRGHRFSRPGSLQPGSLPPTTSRPMDTLPESHQDRRERLLRQMQDNPRVAYMLEHGPVPHWAKVARQQQERAERKAKEARAARLSEEPVPADLPGMLPRGSRGRHRAPRRWWSWPALAISSVLLFGHASTEAVGQAATRTGGFPL
ncbi:hypothetical protein [Nocardiopsis ganjiahuensis]|uniref:hypothetical protein n=1 Tax=Nocardiopsis ganjiahuensis TaxID=239984 RepID=UPI00034B19C7|nr:hypothetical protein [Nocardiopsis ganjiahuensis]